MKHEGLLSLVTQNQQFASFLYFFEKEKCEQFIHGLSSSQKTIWAAAAFKEIKIPLVFVASDTKEAKEALSDLSVFFPSEEVEYLPPRELLPYGVYTKSSELQMHRLRVIKKIAAHELNCLVLSPETLAQTLIPSRILKNSLCTIAKGRIIDYEQLIKTLSELGYERVELVQFPGQFSSRGGIVDVFSSAENYPFRIEFFDDEVESIRLFEADSQRSIETVQSITLYPARELLFGEEEKEKGIKELKKVGQKHAELKNISQEFIENLEQGIWTEDMASLQPLLFDEQQSILDYFEIPPVVFLSEPMRIYETVLNLEKERMRDYSEWLKAGKILPSFDKLYYSKEQLKGTLKNYSLIHLASLPRQIPGANLKNLIGINAKLLPAMSKIKILAEEIRTWKNKRYAVVILTTSYEKGYRIKDELKTNKIGSHLVEDLDGPLYNGRCYISTGDLNKGFEIPTLKLVVLTEKEVSGRREKQRRAGPAVKGAKIDTFSDLKEGDYVVHAQHGIGRYLGIENLELTKGIRKDYLNIEYAGKDKLYLPTDQIDHIRKYVGAEAYNPKLSRLGGSEWAKAKKRVRESVKEMAKSLMELYAYREMSGGYAFSEDDDLQNQFEEEFEYIETPGQKKAIEEVKKDMMKETPMDRLICGDVGYGKTEVVMRAAFKAVRDSKQVAVLVPTTVLAQQHYNTFCERFYNYPVNISVLSRFSTLKEQKQTLKLLKTGMIDIIIGTHRLLSKDVSFKSLGLLVIDEEQRFGVSHKEKLKHLRKNVDVITLSATPIPRTLHMALSGARDMSLIETPPENRYPIQTYVVEYSSQLIRDAVRKELEREGQVFFVHNRIEDIDKVKDNVQKLVPEARIGAAHGRMKEHELEKTMLEFISGGYDVLICTSIIENGLDISNVNTLIVNEADTMGLSQLYQIRGRIGRTNRFAYAYFMYNKNTILSEVAEKRLSAVRDFTELGSGFKIAMRDLELRGAGNLLGPEQHGHMLTVGFDLYCRLLQDEVKRLKGEDSTAFQEEESADDIPIELNVNAFISDNFIEDNNIKMDIYQQLAAATNNRDIDQVLRDLRDRFGDFPREVENLVMLFRIKLLAIQCGVRQVKQEGDKVAVEVEHQEKITGDKLLMVSSSFDGRISFSTTSDSLKIKCSVKGLTSEKMLVLVEDILKKFQKLKS